MYKILKLLKQIKTLILFYFFKCIYKITIWWCTR